MYGAYFLAQAFFLEGCVKIWEDIYGKIYCIYLLRMISIIL